MNCIYCNNKKLYKVSTTQMKCSRCKRKFSIKKIARENSIRECFENDISAKECAKKLGLNYITVNNNYMNIRKQIAIKLEEEYNKHEHTSYDEYIYIEKSKLSQGKLSNAKDIITFTYDKTKVYNLLLPELTRYAEAEQKELKRFLGLNKLTSESKDTTFSRFWNYFEESIVKYKGVSDEYFFYYLKEIEWKFNNKLL